MGEIVEGVGNNHPMEDLNQSSRLGGLGKIRRQELKHEFGPYVNRGPWESMMKGIPIEDPKRIMSLKGSLKQTPQLIPNWVWSLILGLGIAITLVARGC